MFLGSIFALSVGIAWVRYWRYRYRLTEHELVVEKGWIYRNVRHIAYERVQNINITQNPLHRLLGVSGMQLESASGSEPEAVMDALAQRDMDELQDRVEEAKAESPEPEVGKEKEDGSAEPGRSDGAEPGMEVAGPRAKGEREPRRQVLRLGLGELVRYGLISNRGMVLVAALVGFLFQGRLAERVLPGLLGWIERFTDQPPTEVVEALGPLGWFLVALGFFLAVMSVLSLLSVAFAIIRFYNFTLSVDSKHVRAEYGLFTRVAITIPKHRIQLIGVRANPFHRWWRRVSVRVETAGLSGSEETLSTLRWLAPILPERELGRVLREVQPEVDWDHFEWRPLHPRTRVRLLRIRLGLVVLVVVLLGWKAGWGGLWVAAFLPLVWLYARGYFRYAGWAVTSTAVAFRGGWIVKSQSVVRYPKIQVVGVTRNPFDRRWGMATVTADTAGADLTGHGVQIRFMEEEAAQELRDLLEDKTRTTAFVW
jgi:putative membrane protein